MELTLMERQTLARLFAKKYRLATKSQKRTILDEFTSHSGLNRNYSSRLLSGDPAAKKKKSKPSGRTIKYDDAVRKAVEEIWEILDYICSKRLVAAFPEMVARLEHFKEIKIDSDTKKNLMKISASTVERLLGPARKKLGRRGASMTKSGKYIIDRIPIKTFGEWTDTPPGFAQMDLVAHNGGNVFGGFMHTLTSTDVCSGWTLCNLVRDKTEFQMLKGLFAMRNGFPFPLRGMHSDNGGEFINKTVIRFAEKNAVEFTRGRPYKKNDCARVEQKNYSITRRNTGYLRYDRPEHAGILKELYEYLNLYVNYFQPIMMLVEKHRIGAKAIKKYDLPRTPYQRLLERGDIAVSVKKSMRKIYRALNPRELKRKINDCRKRLIRLAAPIRAPNKRVKVRRQKETKHTTPRWRRNLQPDSPNPFLERQRMEEMRRAAATVWDKRE